MDLALYRKYRPKTFKEVLGQDHAVKVLEGQVKLKRISHAYLFSGSRGTGKTSVARIFAQAIGVSGNDLYEIDAASNRGIDEIRALREAVSTLPFESPYKVYIVDEAHMLTREAWNAFLKTLEEPPAHIIFILATTEEEKIPETILSRCQSFKFKKPSQKILKEVVLEIAKKEGFEIAPSSAELIALLGDGSFRDAEGILQKVLSSSKDKKVSAEEVEMATGAPRASLVNDYLSSLASGKSELGLDAIRRAVLANVDMKIFARLILQKIRFIMLLRFAQNAEAQIKDELSESDFAFVKKLSAEKESRINSQSLLEMLSAYDSIGSGFLPQLPLELAIVKLAS